MISDLAAGDDVRPFPLRFFLLSTAVIFATALAMSASVWFVKKESQRSYSQRAARLTQTAQADAQKSFDSHMATLAGTAQALGGKTVTKDAFKDAAAAAVKKEPALSALNYINGDFVVDEVYPFAANRMALNMDLKSRFDVLPVAHRAITNRKPSITDLIDLPQGGKGFALYVPLFREERWNGFVEGIFKISDFTAAFIEKTVGDDYNFTIIDETNGREVYTSLLPTQYERSTPFDTYFTLKVADRTWWVILHPKSPPLILLPLIVALLLELCLGAYGLHHLWKKESI